MFVFVIVTITKLNLQQDFSRTVFKKQLFSYNFTPQCIGKVMVKRGFPCRWFDKNLLNMCNNQHFTSENENVLQLLKKSNG